jgi:branched-chain amino acid transport system substrate-binding protein
VRRLLAAVAVAVAAGLGGCGAPQDVSRGGRVTGDTLTVYSLLARPGQGSGRDIVDAEKLVLLEAGGAAGAYAINFISLDEGRPGEDPLSGEAAVTLRDMVADPQVSAVIGPAGSGTATAAVPLLNAAGILAVTPGAGYAGFTEAVRPGEPERWQPSGRRTLARLAGDDTEQAAALLAAARAATGERDPRVLVEREPGPVADALVAALRAAGANLVEDPGRADAAVYAGEDPESAAGVADGLAREAPGVAIVLPDALTRAGVAGRLGAAARRRAVLVSSAPEPGSTPALRRFEQAFRARIGRAPGPYAAVGYEAMRSVLDAIARAGDRAGSRQAVIDAYFDPAVRRGTVLGTYRITAGGLREPAPFTAFRPREGGPPEYLALPGL